MNKKSVAITGVSGSASAKVIADILEAKKQYLIIVPGRSRAEKLSEDLSFFCDRRMEVLPPDEEVFLKYEAKNQDNEIKRSRVIKALEEDDELIVLAPASGAIKRLPSKEKYFPNIEFSVKAKNFYQYSKPF